jgi:ubiquinone/menaquinone biosynthesis C-methylase UbiE
MPWFFRRKKQAVQESAPAPEGPRFSWLMGRKRLASAPYLLASDFVEANRLDMQHFMLKTAFGGNATAPIQQPMSILDVGCGTGRWAREMALQFPQANVVGIDIKEPETNVAASQQAELGMLPDNYTFVQGDITKGLPFADATFDYTHLRFLSLALPMAQWPNVLREMHRVTRPGGWIEIVEFNIPTGGGPAFEEIQVYWKQLAAKFGMHPGAGSAILPYMRETPLQRVQERVVVLDTADRSRTARMAAVDLYTGLASSGPAMINVGIVPKERFDALYAQVRDDITRHSTKWELHAVTGQRAGGVD